MFLVLSLSQADVTGGHQLLDQLVAMDREVAGLLDAYLEAVPECPAGEDTPLRLWVLDLAWLRADAAIDSVSRLNYSVLFPDSQKVIWTDFISATTELFAVYTEIQQFYHDASPLDSIECMELEDRLIMTDSLWRGSEAVLFSTIAEEELL